MIIVWASLDRKVFSIRSASCRPSPPCCLCGKSSLLSTISPRCLVLLYDTKGSLEDRAYDSFSLSSFPEEKTYLHLEACSWFVFVYWTTVNRSDCIVYGFLEFRLICKDFQCSIFDGVFFVVDVDNQEELSQHSALWDTTTGFD